jgi:hypothetical protein
MKRLLQLSLAVLVLASALFPFAAWARTAKNQHHVEHHKVRHVKRHKAHRTGPGA